MSEERRPVSRREFLAGVAATSALTAVGAMTGCGASEAADASGVGDASATATSYDVLSDFTTLNRGENPDAVAPASVEAFITLKADGKAKWPIGMKPLGITPADFMLNVPAWLGVLPTIDDIAYEEECEALVIGGGNSGVIAALRLTELGVSTLCVEAQTWDEFDGGACDMATYNSEYLRSLGVPEYNALDVFNEYMKYYGSYANQKIVRDYATRSGEALDWVLTHLPADFIDAYAQPMNVKGNAHYKGEILGRKSFIGTISWRDMGTNNNVWPWGERILSQAAQKLGCKYIYGAQGIELVQNESGDVVGAICRDIDGAYFKVNAKTVIVCTGDYGGNPDMVLDLIDYTRNVGWAYGADRTDASAIGSVGRDGSGIRMCLWAGATMEPGPRATQSIGINQNPQFAFGGRWPTFGPDGKRFLNESLTTYGVDGYMDMQPPGSIYCSIVDANWNTYSQYQGYGHEMMDRNDEHVAKTIEMMSQYKTGADGFPVQIFARYGTENLTTYAGETLEELGQAMGYEGDALQGLVDEIAHWNEMCAAGVDADWGCDPGLMFPIKEPPFFGTYSVVAAGPTMTAMTCSGVCTDNRYNVVRADKSPIKGLYAGGNVCGQRYGIRYWAPSPGNCLGSAITSTYIAAEYVAADLGK